MQLIGWPPDPIGSKSESDWIPTLKRIRIYHPNPLGWIPSSLLPSPLILWEVVLALPSIGFAAWEQEVVVLATIDIAGVEELAAQEVLVEVVELIAMV